MAVVTYCSITCKQSDSYAFKIYQLIYNSNYPNLCSYFYQDKAVTYLSIFTTFSVVSGAAAIWLFEHQVIVLSILFLLSVILLRLEKLLPILLFILAGYGIWAYESLGTDMTRNRSFSEVMKLRIEKDLAVFKSLKLTNTLSNENQRIPGSYSE